MPGLGDVLPFAQLDRLLDGDVTARARARSGESQRDAPHAAELVALRVARGVASGDHRPARQHRPAHRDTLT